ncbi:right-handed parallel beta-helix repeat-containing protein [Sandarakinorhabdus sp. AAP62]|uniref:right-handed parallel beta-helix repeat-containing protein n=1 Tax=Sandarakinorhabdus sp. AAP62 TaxID=1248916 RepID=UPI0002E58C5D|nr:right-handed parallel beta-helix repeat-containing protein [Sandarakinorhabdus sp. AAP62]
MKKRIIGAGLALAGVGAMAIGLLPQPSLLAAQARGDVVEVADGAALQNAIMWARAGSTIRLADGQYPQVLISREIDGSPIRITGSRGARINRMIFRKAANWRVDGVTIVGGIGKAMPLDIGVSRNIMMVDVKLTGSTPDEGPRWEESNAFVIQNSQHVVIALSEATHVKQIAGIRDSWGVVIEGNRFTNAREGLMTRATHGMMIRHNLFVGWEPRYDLREHPDMIQFFTQQVPTGSSMVTIEGNYLSAGLDRNVQAIFIRAEAYENGKEPLGYHRDFTIRHNVYYGSSRHGISVSSVRGVVVENNTIISSPHGFFGSVPRDQIGRASSGWQPAIIASGITWGRVSNNITALMAIRAESIGTKDINNFVYKPRVPADSVNPGKTFPSPLTAGDLPLSAFAVLPSSENGKRGRGADIRRVGPDAAIRDPEALMREAIALADAARKQDLTKDLLPPQ